MKSIKILPLNKAIILISFIVGMVLYPQLPQEMVTHWGISGQADGISNKFVGVFLLPIILTLITFILSYFPNIDPLKENVKKFKRQYNTFLITMPLFFLYLYVLVLLWNLGIKFNFVQFLLPAFGILFYIIGDILIYTKQNWFMGFRTPWTLSNSVVWDKTNKLGGKYFKICGAISILGVFIPNIAFYFVIFPILIGSIILFFYSYLVYKKELKK